MFLRRSLFLLQNFTIHALYVFIRFLHMTDAIDPLINTPASLSLIPHQSLNRPKPLLTQALDTFNQIVEFPVNVGNLIIIDMPDMKDGTDSPNQFIG